MNEKVALITGASSGIGRATALLFAQNGINVIAVGRNEGELTDLRNEAKEAKGLVKTRLTDIAESYQVDRLVSETVQHFGQIDVLVNSAGIIKTGSVENTSLELCRYPARLF